MSRDCEAQRSNDQMLCGRCGLSWDVGDAERPACRRAIDRRVIPDRPLTRMVRQADEAERYVPTVGPKPPVSNLQARMRFVLRTLLADLTKPPEPLLEQELRDLLQELDR